MQINSRQKKILLTLLENAERTTGKQLANYLNVSLRTLQKEIHNINEILPGTISSTNRGYKLTNKEQVTIGVNLSLNETASDEKVLQKKIFLSGAPLDIDELADNSYLSRSVLNKYLNNFKSKLKNYHLKLERKNNKIYVSGDEYDKRLFIRNSIFSEISSEHQNLDTTTLKITPVDYNHIKSIIISAIEKFNCYVEKPYLTNLIINVLITLSRAQNYHFIDNMNFHISETTIEYQISKEICSRLSKHWLVSFSKKDIEYIALSINGQIEPKQSLDSITTNYQISNTIKAIIKKVFTYYLLSLDYDEILPNFITHIRSLLKRAVSQQFVSSTAVFNTIKETSPFTYDVAIHLTKMLEDKFKIKIPPEEIDLLSIYIGYVIEQSSQKDERIKVGICCPDYRQISRQLSKQLTDNFSNKIQIIFMDKSTPSPQEISKAELLISTIKFNALGKPFALISPFFSEDDKLKIEKKVILVQQMRNENEKKELLAHYFNQNLFFKNRGISSKDEAIYFLGNAIVDEGITHRNFIQSVYQRESISSTCFFNLFAVPHAIELNAKKTQIAVLLEENGIEWEKDHKINSIFMIAVSHSDRKEFMKLYNSFIQVLCNPSSIQKIVHSNSFDQFLTNFLH